jgi:hypothetical protein
VWLLAGIRENIFCSLLYCAPIIYMKVANVYYCQATVHESKPNKNKKAASDSITL